MISCITISHTYQRLPAQVAPRQVELVAGDIVAGALEPELERGLANDERQRFLRALTLACGSGGAVGSARDRVTRALSRETESGLRYKMLTRSDGHHPSDTRGPKCEKLPS